MRVRTGFLLLAIFFSGALTSSLLGWSVIVHEGFEADIPL